MRLFTVFLIKRQDVDLDTSKRLKYCYRTDLFDVLVKTGVFISRCFQDWVKTDVFQTIFNYFKPGVMYKKAYFKIANEHYISSISD